MNRVFWLDAARAIAILLVVFTHSHEIARIDDNLLKSIFYSIDRMGVPIFFMISGGLIIPKAYNCDVLSFYKKRIPKFILLLVFWSFITSFIALYFINQDIIKSLHDAALRNGIYPSDYGAASQMWFLYSITLMYLISPFLSKMLHGMLTRDIVIFLGICITVNQFSNTASSLGGDWVALQRLGTDFTGPYLCYYIIGYLIIERSILNHVKSAGVLLIAIVTIASISTPIIMDWDNRELTSSLYWYTTSIFLLISSIGLLLLIKMAFQNINVRFVTLLSKYSFGVFLSHTFFMYIARAWFRANGTQMDKIIVMLVYFVFSLVCSLLLTHALLKNKYARHLVS